ncbi:MAG: peptidase renal dipeptidase [Alphaproteobacteria bacterium]|nr:peptidase renal dipeptidase [Alphaproteobacteria bacterium]
MKHRLLALLMLTLAGPAAAQSLRLDAHFDLPASASTPGWTGLSDPSSQFDLEKARAGGLTAGSIALFVRQGDGTPEALAQAQKDLVTRDAAIHAIAERNPGRAGLALSPADVRKIIASGRFAVIESMLNPWPVGSDLDAFDRWHARGVRIVGFVHAGHNQFADSSRPALERGEVADQNGGLTPLGRQAIARLNDLGILIDVSQLSEKGFAQALALSRAPVIASHSNIRAIVDHPRNLTDAQLDAIKAKRGVVAINAFSAWVKARSAATMAQVAALRRSYGLSEQGSAGLSPEKQKEYDRRYHEITEREPKATLADFIDSVDYAVKRIGVDHVGLSSDFNHGGGVVGWNSDADSANVTAELKKRGYSDRDIAKLWGGNVLRVWQAAIDARAPAKRAPKRV